MKIAILSLPINDNYGGILQAYSLSKYLLGKGHQVNHIELNSTSSVVHWSKFKFNLWWYTKRILKEIIVNKDELSEKNKNLYKLWEESEEVRRFVTENLNVIRLKNFKDLKKHNFDCIIVGSDQIWRPKYYNNIENAFLSFSKKWNIKRISFAPSFGVDDWEFNKHSTEICGNMLRSFDKVSVREDSGVRLCRDHFGINVEHLIDPTLLLSVKQYESVAEFKKPIKKPSITVTSYVLDSFQSKHQVIDSLCSEFGYYHEKLTLTGQGKKISVENWLNEFLLTDYIITDSFHGCVFAILFHKPFVTFGNIDRGLTRFKSLLNLFNLEDRLLINLDEKSISSLLHSEIDWKKVDHILDLEREKAFTFLNMEF